MPTVIVRSEVEATPELIAKNLLAFAALSDQTVFPHPRGTFLKLAPDYVANMQGIEGMPVLVVMTGAGSPLGLIAMHKPNGDVVNAFISDQVVEKIWNSNL